MFSFRRMLATRIKIYVENLEKDFEILKHEGLFSTYLKNKLKHSF